jgi:hypothetical protein
MPEWWVLDVTMAGLRPPTHGRRQDHAEAVLHGFFQGQKRGPRGASPLPRPDITRGFIGSSPSRCSFLRASLRRAELLLTSRGLSSRMAFRNACGALSRGKGSRAASSSSIPSGLSSRSVVAVFGCQRLYGHQRWTLRFSADVLPRFDASSYSTTCPSFSVVRPARSTAEM